MIKKIGNDSLILITPNQGAMINKKYVKLVDTIKTISSENKNLKTNVDSLSTRLKLADLENNRLKNSLINSDNSIKYFRDNLYNKDRELEDYKRRYQISNRSENVVTIFGIGVTLTVWITLFILGSKN